MEIYIETIGNITTTTKNVKSYIIMLSQKLMSAIKFIDIIYRHKKKEYII